jgi:hypothetical protein
VKRHISSYQYVPAHDIGDFIHQTRTARIACSPSIRTIPFSMSDAPESPVRHNIIT